MLLCLFYIGGNAQTQFWSDTFEDSGAPSNGTRTPSIAEFTCGRPPATACFMITPTGSGMPVGNMQPYLGLRYIITSVH